jgi:hypothetical protein
MDLRMNKAYERTRRLFWPAALIIIAILLYSKGIFNQDTFYPDADRIAMDGVYFRDVLKDMLIKNFYDYTIRYFAQYPALSIGCRLPFFQVVMGIFYLIFGISMTTAKMTVFAFAHA